MKTKDLMIFLSDDREATVRIVIKGFDMPEPNDTLENEGVDFELGGIEGSRHLTKTLYCFTLPIKLEMPFSYQTNTRLDDYDENMLEDEGFSDNEMNVHFRANTTCIGNLKVVFALNKEGEIQSTSHEFNEIHSVSIDNVKFAIFHDSGEELLELDENAYEEDVDVCKRSIEQYIKSLVKTKVDLELGINHDQI